MPAKLTEAEALLRVALLVSRADGHESPEEMVAVAQALGNRLGGPGIDTTQLWNASMEITTTPAKEILKRVTKALPETARIRAFEVACEVAKADNRLHWNETSQMVDVAKALGLKEADVRKVATAYWN
ncbi:MAG: TerB family tellurite resistance protein [Thermoplasmatota archaeon]